MDSNQYFTLGMFFACLSHVKNMHLSDWERAGFQRQARQMFLTMDAQQRKFVSLTVFHENDARVKAIWA